MSADAGGSPETLVIKALTGVGGGGAFAAIFVLLSKVLPGWLSGTTADAKAMRDEYRAEFQRYTQELKDLRAEMVAQKEAHEKEIETLRSEYEAKITELTSKLDLHTNRYTRVFADRAAARAIVNSLEVQLSLTLTTWPADEA